jgi:hypothetical protein
MAYSHSPVVDGIGRMLHDRLEQDARERLPKRWVDLIHRLNEKEKEAERRTEVKDHSSPCLVPKGMEEYRPRLERLAG